MTVHFNRAQRRSIQKVAKARGLKWDKAEVDRICDGIEQEVFNKPKQEDN